MCGPNKNMNEVQRKVKSQFRKNKVPSSKEKGSHTRQIVNFKEISLLLGGRTGKGGKKKYCFIGK